MDRPGRFPSWGGDGDDNNSTSLSRQVGQAGTQVHLTVHTTNFTRTPDIGHCRSKSRFNDRPEACLSNRLGGHCDKLPASLSQIPKAVLLIGAPYVRVVR